MVFAYVTLTITHPEIFDAYRAKAAGALERHGGAPLVASKTFTTLEGDPQCPDLAVILRFPDKASAIGWIEDPSLADVHGLRRSAGRSDIVLLG